MQNSSANPAKTSIYSNFARPVTVSRILRIDCRLRLPLARTRFGNRTPPLLRPHSQFRPSKKQTELLPSRCRQRFALLSYIRIRLGDSASCALLSLLLLLAAPGLVFVSSIDVFACKPSSPAAPPPAPSVQGVVADPTGAIVPGAEVDLVDTTGSITCTGHSGGRRQLPTHRSTHRQLHARRLRTGL